MDKISVCGMRFLDDKGRTRIFSGMNLDDKTLNGERFKWALDEDFFADYAANGFDLIRLGLTWQNLEPAPGKYNETYLQSVDEIFRLAEKAGVYILLDLHQDLYSAFDGEGVGDGAPMWASLTDGHRARPPKFVWAEGYVFGKCVHRAFDHFWNNDPVGGRGLQNRFADLWAMLALRYGDSPALFGFDFLNEPFPGTRAKKLLRVLLRRGLGVFLFSRKVRRGKLLVSLLKKDLPAALEEIGGGIVRDIVGAADPYQAEFDRGVYAPFLNKMAAAVRGVTDNGVLMMEQSYLCNGGVKQSCPPIAVNGAREQNQCFGPHGYDMTVDTPLYKYAKTDRVKAFFGEMKNTQRRLNVPVIVGEWGGVSDNTDTSWFPHGRALLEYFDENLWSRTYWDYHGDDLSSPLMGLLRRARPVAVSGDLKAFRSGGHDLVLHLFADGGETLVYIPSPLAEDPSAPFTVAKAYPNGAAVLALRPEAGEREIAVHF